MRPRADSAGARREAVSRSSKVQGRQWPRISVGWAGRALHARMQCTVPPLPLGRATSVAPMQPTLQKEVEPLDTRRVGLASYLIQLLSQASGSRQESYL